MLSYPETGIATLRRVPSRENFESVQVSVVRNLDDLQKVFAIRAAVFLVEQDCPYAEEYDGNDLTSLHLVASVAGEPVATLRLRWFADFGKVERVCVRPQARARNLDRILLAHAFEIAARKGYRLMIGQIQARLWPLWSRVLKCRLREDRPRFAFSGYDYFEIEIPVPMHQDALTSRSDPYILIRPEGAWSEPGILESAPDDKEFPHRAA